MRILVFTLILGLFNSTSYACKQDDFLSDVLSNDEFAEAFSKNAELVESWKILHVFTDETLSKNLDEIGFLNTYLQDRGRDTVSLRQEISRNGDYLS